MKSISKVTLEIDLHTYKHLAQVIRAHREFIYRLKINELIKKSLVRDMNIIASILEKSETKPKEVEPCIQST
jgi:hypothetical protein